MTYLDHAATTPMRPEAVAAMVPWLEGPTGNPSGAHRAARRARRALDDARDTFAAALGFAPGDIVFTAGGTEADNLAITGVVEAADTTLAVCPATEHHAVLDPVVRLGGVVVGVGADGSVDLDQLADALSDDVAVVSMMAVNNETGIISGLVDAVALVRERAPRAAVHTDAVQALSWTDLSHLGALVDLVSLSAHKFGGPQGVGVLAVRPGVALRPLLLGGGQERGRRSGTQNVAGIVAASVAAEVAITERETSVPRITALRDRLADGLAAAVPGLVETGLGCSPPAVGRSRRAAGHLHVCLPDVEAEALLVLLDDAGVSASAASSCASGAQDPSHVLAAMGVARELAVGSLRLTLGWTSTDADVDAALEVIPAAVERLRAHR